MLLFPHVLNAQHIPVCSHANYPLKSYENPLFDRWLSAYDVSFYHISLEVSNENTEIDGFATIVVRALESMDTLVLQLIDELSVTDIEVDSTLHPDFLHANDVLYIPVSANQGDIISVKIDYNGDAGQDRGFFAGISRAKDNTTDMWVTYTLSEPLNAQDWFPVKQVLADKADSLWVDITCDKNLMSGSNGLLEEVVEISSSEHMFKWRSNYPIAYYLISFAVGDYQDYSFMAPLSQPGDSVLVQNYIYNSDTYLDLWKNAIDETGDLINLFSNLVLDYPFAKEKYGHTTAPMGGGMEHQTMTTLVHFGFTLVAHELAHQWFGDNVTCGSWQDIWINEGFASYMEYIALQNLRSQEAADQWMYQAMGLALNEPDGSVYVPEEEAENVYRVFNYELSYKKGASILHMLRNELNDDDMFFSVLRSFQERYKDDVATAVEFRSVVDSISGEDYSWFFDQWYYGSGFPQFNLAWYRENDTLYIHSLQEGSSSKTPFFKTHFEISVETGESSLVYRFFQQKNEEVFTIPMNSRVNNLQFDPGSKLLAKSSVQITIPKGKLYIAGPNPFTSSVLIRLNQVTGQEWVEIISIDGKRLLRESIETNPYEFNLSELTDGSYLMIVNIQGQVFQEKIIKATLN